MEGSADGLGFVWVLAWRLSTPPKVMSARALPAINHGAWFLRFVCDIKNPFFKK
ncbi:hypothetical protein N42_1517 [Lactococcus lactis subsp. lactis]|uniref:Uncharacterized protein n=1 Tax=Lactococcus lactis subsp. lactis TaxID=1360 RepID=A0A0V8EL37_LACLL|nr:hypothetical protein ATCC19435_0275 [Lactococcus lactis subsp. lactis]KSU26579.1 hypothetical protein N42_1517 [Lactococcus lactis subsp. lactis]